MALDDNKISFSVDVATGQSEKNINSVIDRIDGLKDKINELKKLRKESKDNDNLFANYTKNIRDTERELSKLQSVYNSWIQKATNVDTKPIGDVKKQTQEFISLLKQWDGQTATFQKQVMSHFMIPNSAVDQLRLYKNIMQEIEGIQSKNTIKNFPAYKALQQLTDMAQVAQKSVERLNATLSNTALGAYRRWNGEGSFVNTLPGYGDYSSLSKRRRQVKSAYDELVGYFGADAKYIPAAQSALKQLEEEYQKLTRMAKEAKESLNGTQTDTSKIDKQKQSTEQLAEAEQKLSRIRQQLKDWDGTSPFSSTINGFSGMDSYARQIQALRRAYEELNATNTRPLNSIRPFTQEEAAIRSVKAEYDALVAKKNQVDAELKKGTEDVASTSKKAANEEAKSVKKTIDEYTRLKLRMAEIQEQIKNNYVTNFKTNPALYNTNFARLSAEYREVAELVNQADRNMARFATRADFAGRAMDRLYQRSAWFFSAIGANAIIAVPNAWYDAQTKIENSMAQFSQVMATNSHSVNAFKTALFDMDFGKLQQGLNTTSVQSKEFIKDLDYMKNSLINLAIKYGEASDDVIKSATLWGRKYKDNQTVLTMTNAAMKLAVADSFSIVEANKNLESSLVQWGFQIKDNNDAMIVSNKIIDSWTALAHKMAVSAQDLSAANQRAAQSMRAVGLSFDEGQALIATMLANTQQAGGEIGNAVKSIMGSIHSKKAIEDLEAMGVAVYKFGENGKKEFREVGKVLVDLMLKTQNSKENLEKLLKDVSGGKIAICPSLK